MYVSGIPEQMQSKTYESLKKTYRLYRFFRDHRSFNDFVMISSSANTNRFNSTNLKVLSEYKYYFVQMESLSRQFITLALRRIVGGGYGETKGKALTAKDMK